MSLIDAPRLQVSDAALEERIRWLLVSPADLKVGKIPLLLQRHPSLLQPPDATVHGQWSERADAAVGWLTRDVGLPVTSWREPRSEGEMLAHVITENPCFLTQDVVRPMQMPWWPPCPC